MNSFNLIMMLFQNPDTEQRQSCPKTWRVIVCKIPNADGVNVEIFIHTVVVLEISCIFNSFLFFYYFFHLFYEFYEIFTYDHIYIYIYSICSYDILCFLGLFQSNTCLFNQTWFLCSLCFNLRMHAFFYLLIYVFSIAFCCFTRNV